MADFIRGGIPAAMVRRRARAIFFSQPPASSQARAHDDCPFQTEGAFTAGSRGPLFSFRYEQGGHDYAVMPDGQHFICIKESGTREQCDADECRLELECGVAEEIKSAPPAFKPLFKTLRETSFTYSMLSSHHKSHARVPVDRL